MTPRRTSTIKRRERLSAAIDALAAAVPGGALMAATDPADFLLAVRCHIEAAEERAIRAERERDDAIAIRSCECGVEEACRLVRERDEARGEAERITAKRRRLASRARRLLARVRAERALSRQAGLWVIEERDAARAEAARHREALERVSEVLAANGCDCECDHDVESHDDDCERCVACRVSLALAGQDAGKETE